MTMTSFLESIGFRRCISDECFFIRRNHDELVRLALYVDDLAIAATESKHLQAVKSALMNEYKMKDLGKLEKDRVAW